MDKLITRRDFLKVAAMGLGSLAFDPEKLSVPGGNNGSMFSKEELEQVKAATETLYEDEEARLIRFTIPPEKEGVEFTQLKELLQKEGKDIERADVNLLLEKGHNESESMLLTFSSGDVYVFYNSKISPIKSKFLVNCKYYDFFQCDLLKGGNFVIETKSDVRPIDNKVLFFQVSDTSDFEEVFSIKKGDQRSGRSTLGPPPVTEIGYNDSIQYYFQTNDRKLAKFNKQGKEVSVETHGFNVKTFALEEFDFHTLNVESPLLFSGKDFICYPKVNPHPSDSKQTVDFVLLTDKGNKTVVSLSVRPSKIHEIAKKFPSLSSVSNKHELERLGAYQPFSKEDKLLGVVTHYNPETWQVSPWIFIGKNAEGYKLFEWPQTATSINNLNIPEDVPYQETYIA